MEQLELEPPECSSPSCDAHTSEPHAGTDKRRDINTLATAAQFSLVCVFLGGAFIKLFSGDTAEDDAEVFRVVVVMVFFNFAVLGMYVSLAAYQFTTADVLPSIRLLATRQPPELKLAKDHKFHLFLSHIWLSGQDQMATVKRELQLLLMDVKVFLDVDGSPRPRDPFCFPPCRHGPHPRQRRNAAASLAQTSRTSRS